MDSCSHGRNLRKQHSPDAATSPLDLPGCSDGLGKPDEVGAEPGTADRKTYSPYVGEDYPDQVLYGDTHVHTKYSPDAGMAGTTLSPDDAYRFAKGETVTSSTGIPVRLQRPLDWLAVTDHAENLGLPVAIAEQDASLMANEWGREMAELFVQGTQDAARAAIDEYQTVLNALEDPLEDTDFGRKSWDSIIDAAESHNAPGAFTAFIGFEWATAPGTRQLRLQPPRQNRGSVKYMTPSSTPAPPDPSNEFA